MKKTVFSALAAVLLLAPNAGAQVFNHLSLGVGAGTDRVSFELASPIGNHVQLRAGFGTAFGAKLYSGSIDMSDILDDNPLLAGQDLTSDFDLRLGRNDAHLLFNIYPFAKAGFHVTVGAYFGTPVLARLNVWNIPAEAELAGLTVNDKPIKIENGTTNASLYSANSFRPYFGLGFGRAVRADRRVTFTTDLGALYQGPLGASIAGTAGDIELMSDEMWDELGVAGLKSVLGFCPTINFHLFVRLF